MEDFADKVARLCIEKYAKLSKTGKPSNNEWTVLSGIILKSYNGELSLVALATGTKCLGELELLNTEVYNRGCRLSDSHAEILARRAFIRYLYDQIDLLLACAESQVFVVDKEKKIRLREGTSFHFFSSQTPCGDCSIFPKESFDEDQAPPIKLRKRDDGSAIKDIYRTGAKCVKNEVYRDRRLPGADYHVVGPLRTKPGRGDPTLSLSCSDKMAKWNILGLQGSLLSLLIPKINMESITIGGDCPFSLEAMERGLYRRFGEDIPTLKILRAKLSFTEKKGPDRRQPCPTSIIWCAVRERDTEIAVGGRKQGATKKKKGSNLLVSRRAVFETFLKVCDKYQNIDCNTRHPKKITYLDCKASSTNYRNSWNKLKSESFRAWPSKSSCLQMFVL